jgi:hypothetical protein
VVTNTAHVIVTARQKRPAIVKCVGDDEHALLVVLPPAQAMVGARRDQQHGRERRRDERREEDVAPRRAQLSATVIYSSQASRVKPPISWIPP